MRFSTETATSRVLEALAGKDVRRALEIFGAIITSGYLSTTTIASNTLGGGDVWLKEHTILRILMRTNRRLFSKDSGFVQNIFAYDETCEKPDNFLLIELLFYLFRNKKTVGLINVEGYFTCTQIADAMQKMGYVPDDVFLTLKHLVRTELVVTDRMNTTDLIWQDSIRILAAGWVHLRLLSGRFEYLFGCIPTSPIHDQKTAQQLADLVKIEAERGELLFHQKVRAVEIFFEYLWRERQAAVTPFNDGPESGAEYVLSHIQQAIETTKNPLKARSKERGEDILDL